MNEAKTKSQIVEKITNSTNVLVTVSKDPSVDALSAAIGLTVILNKLGKHTTAIFSGATPPAITFLDPEKTFEASIDSLRDFIIALDKEKADHLRYKVEGDLVKIFITPYRTTISNEDLEFSQGDYNVELVLALGVENQTHLDAALEAHGSILHDATVVTISTGETSSSLGSIDWHDATTSSLSEMVVGLTESLQTDTPLIDQQVATALLTGIVAETDRFSNTKTSSKVMTMAAQLMAAGADQQLIAAKLQESHEIGAGATPTGSNSAYTTPLVESGIVPPSVPTKEGMAITHEEVAPAVVAPPTPAPTAAPVVVAPVVEPVIAPPATIDTPPVTAPPVIGKIADAYALDPDAPAEAPATPTVQPLLGGVPTAPPIPAPTAPLVVEPIVPATPPPLPEMTTPLAPPPAPPTITPLMPTTDSLQPLSSPLIQPSPVMPPAPTLPDSSMTSPLSPLTPTPDPLVPAPSEEVSKHSYLGGASPSFGLPVTDSADAGGVDIFATPPPAPTLPSTSPLTAPSPVDTLAVPAPALEKSRDEASRDDALAAVNAAYGGVPATPGAFSPAPGITLPPPPPLPDFGALPTPAASPYALDSLPQPAAAPERLGDILASPPPATNDPGQFKIPGQ